jgi:hypothetical protein
MKKRLISKEALNAAKQKRPTFSQKSFSLGSVQKFRWDKALEVAVTAW